jgi:PKD repeat protein
MHTCDIDECSAECVSEDDCDVIDCDNLDGCYNGVWRDYHDVQESCNSCLCESQTCTDYTPNENDPRCGAVADANGPYECDEGDSITLDGSGSYSNDGTIVSYHWDLDNDGNFDDATGLNPDYDCEDDFDGKIALKVVDSNNKEGIDQADFKINNVDPTSGIDAPAEGDVGVPVDFDENGADPGDDELTFNWDFGDGSMSNEQDPSHIYDAAGDYEVRLTISDDDGGSDSASVNIKIYETRKIPLDDNITMFSLPLMPKNPVSFNDIKGNCNLLNGPTYYDADVPGFIDARAGGVLYPGQGYFVQVEDACSLILRGMPFDYDDGVIGFQGTSDLKAGWNLIGAGSEKTHYWYVKGDCVFTVAAGSSGPWIYDVTKPEDYYFRLTAFLEPGKGYYVKVPNACTFDGEART